MSEPIPRLQSWTLQVNGKAYQVSAPAEMPLLWILRTKLKLTGTKFSCGIARCGACSVHLDGVARPSCTVSVAEAATQEITTIEGLSPDRSHPVQRAWIELQVPQCGYCQSGQIMSAAALLASSPAPSDTEIDAAMSFVLCRCGTYQRIRRAIHRAAELMRNTGGRR